MDRVSPTLGRGSGYRPGRRIRGRGTPQDRHDLAIDATRHDVRVVMLDVFRLTELAGPFPSGELTSRVRVKQAVGLEGHLLETRFRPVIVARFEAQGPERSL
jgi:hypothetical protein